jgi:hypothetical protein
VTVGFLRNCRLKQAAFSTLRSRHAATGRASCRSPDTIFVALCVTMIASAKRSDDIPLVQELALFA